MTSRRATCLEFRHCIWLKNGELPKPTHVGGGGFSGGSGGSGIEGAGQGGVSYVTNGLEFTLTPGANAGNGLVIITHTS